MSQNDWINKINTGIKLDDKYQLIRKQPLGGGGPVYIAIMLERKVPVHVRFFSPELIPDMKVFNQRLQTAKKAHELSSGFVTLPSDYGFFEGVPYIVVGISNLKTLDTFLGSGQRLDDSEKKAFVEALLKMLIQVHSGGIAHYGLSPLSIHQGKESFSSTSIGVVDFGLVPSEGHTYFSQPAQDEKLLDIAAYAAPEQAAGRGDVDHRADLYSLGVLIYRLLTGHVPFEAASVDEILKQVTDETPAGLDGEKGFPEGLGKFLKRALEKNPRDRFQSAADMMESFLEASKEMRGEIVVKDRARPSQLPDKGQPPVVILKVSEKDADRMDEASSQEITAEIVEGVEATTEPRTQAQKKTTHKTDLFIQVPDKVRDEKEAVGSGSVPIKKTRDKTDLFINTPAKASGGAPGDSKPEGEEKAQAAKPAPHKPMFKPVPAKGKTELFIKVEAGNPNPDGKKDGEAAPGKGGVLQAFLKKKEKTIPPVDAMPEAPKADGPKADGPKPEAGKDISPKDQKALDDEKTSEISIEMDAADGTYKIEEKAPGAARDAKQAAGEGYVEFGKAADKDSVQEKKMEALRASFKKPEEKVKKRPVVSGHDEKPSIGRIQLKERRKLVSKPPPKPAAAAAGKDEAVKPVPPPPLARSTDREPDKKAAAKKEIPKPPVPVPGIDASDKAAAEKKAKPAAKKAAAAAAGAAAEAPVKEAEAVEREGVVEPDAERARKMKLYVGIGVVAFLLILIVSIAMISSNGEEASQEVGKSPAGAQEPSEEPSGTGEEGKEAEAQPAGSEGEGAQEETQAQPQAGEGETPSAEGAGEGEGQEEAGAQPTGEEAVEGAEKPAQKTPEKEPATKVKKATAKKTTSPTKKKTTKKEPTTKTKKAPTTKTTKKKKGKKPGLEFVD